MNILFICLWFRCFILNSIPFYSKLIKFFFSILFIIAARNRHHQRYSINNKQSDVEDSPIHSSMYAQPYLSAKLPPSQYNYTNSKNLSKTPSSENGSEATLTESELALARDNTLLVHKGKCVFIFVVVVVPVKNDFIFHII